MSKKNKRHFTKAQSEDPVGDMLESFDLGLVSAEEIIDFFTFVNDKTTPNNKVNEISAAVEQEKEKLLHPLAEKCAQMLELLVRNSN